MELLCFPATCRWCRSTLMPGDHDARWCLECHASLFPRSVAACEYCGAHLAVAAPACPNGGCTYCRDQAFRFAGAFCLGNYDGGLRQCVLRIKRQLDEPLVTALALELAMRVERAKWFSQVDCLLPVPGSPRRRLWRGFDIPELMADRMAEVWGKPVCGGLLSFTRATGKQGMLTRRQRQQNLRGALAPRSQATQARVAGQCILVIDDVLTSGATLNEVTRVLLDAGAASVYGALLARGVRHR